MTEQKDHLPIKQAVDNTLSGLTGNPFLFERLAAQSAQKKEGVNPMKFKYLIAIALVALMCLTVAVASELLSGTVNWDGTLTPDERQQQPVAVATPPVVVMPEETEREALETAFEEANPPKDGEYVIYYDTRAEVPLSGWNRVRCSVASLDELNAAVGDSLALPVSIPAGYVLHAGYVLYGCRPEGEFRLVETVESEDGFRAEKYVIDAEDRVVIGYELDLRQEGFDDPMDAPYVAVYAWIGNWEHDGPAMHLLDVVFTRAAEVPGMEKAVAAQDASISYVEMYAKLGEGVTFRSDVLEEAETCFTADFSVWGMPSADELLAMFGGK